MLKLTDQNQHSTFAVVNTSLYRPAAESVALHECMYAVRMHSSM